MTKDREAVQQLITANKAKRKLETQITNGMEPYIGMQLAMAKKSTKGAYWKIAGTYQQNQAAGGEDEIGYLIKYPTGNLSWATEKAFNETFMLVGDDVETAVSNKLDELIGD